MRKIDIEAEREAFESWFNVQPDAAGFPPGAHPPKPDGTYAWSWKQGMWEAWTARAKLGLS